MPARICPEAQRPGVGEGDDFARQVEVWSAEVPASPDLYCVNLIAIPDLPDASGTVELARRPGPFDVDVTPDGRPRYDLVFRLDGLPEPGSLGPFTTYVAWLTTPVLSPMLRLGAVSNGAHRFGPAEFNKFLILVTAEPDAGGTERRGKIVLRGTSPSSRMQAHDILALPLTALSASDRQAAAAGGTHGWHHPPPHPAVAMLPNLEWLHPRATPYLPGAERARAPLARPRTMVELSDGDTLRLEAGHVRRTIGGREFVMFGFNGQYPGPLLRVGQEATILVDFTNNLELPTSIHWHGVRLENRFDGVPGVTQDPVQPGGRFLYRVHFPDAGIYWYHPHHREDIQQELGLYGNMFVLATDPAYFSRANREEFLMLDDLLIGEQGLVPFGLETPTHALMGRFGNVLLVNGEPTYALAVRRGEVVRFFFTNVSNTRTFNLSLDGARMKLVASDLGLFEREEWVDQVVIAPAERYVIEARFEQPGRTALTNRVQGIDHVFGLFFPERDTLGVIDVDAEPAAEDLGDAFGVLRRNSRVSGEIASYRSHFERPVDHELVLSMDVGELPFVVRLVMRLDSAYFPPVEWSGTMPMMNWASTGKEVRWILRDPATGLENRDIEWRFRVGDVVKVRLVNSRAAFHAMQHPIHIHGQRFLVLSRNGVPNDNLVWKDTMLLPVGSSAEILLELSNPGDWMLHCHIAEHLAAGMATVFRVDPV